MNCRAARTLAIGLALAGAWPAAAPAADSGHIVLAQNCPEGSRDPRCMNLPAAGGKAAWSSSRDREGPAPQVEREYARQQAEMEGLRAQKQAQQAEQLRAQQQAQHIERERARQQAEQQRAQQQAQQFERERARQQAEVEQQRAQKQAQQADQLRAQQQAQQFERERARQQAEVEQQRAQKQAQQADQLRAQQQAQQFERERARQQAEVEQQRAQKQAQQADQLRAQQQAQQFERERARQQAEVEQQRAQKQAQQADQLRAQQQAQQFERERARQQAEVEQQRAQKQAQQADQLRAQQQAQQFERERARQQAELEQQRAQKQAQQADQLRAQQQAQQFERERARQQAELEQQRAHKQAQQADQQRAQQQASQFERERARQQAELEQQRAQKQAQQADQQRAQPQAQQFERERARQQAELEQQRAQKQAQQADQQRAQQQASQFERERARQPAELEQLRAQKPAQQFERERAPQSAGPDGRRDPPPATAPPWASGPGAGPGRPAVGEGRPGKEWSRPAAPQVLTVDAATRVLLGDNRNSVDIHHRNPDGSRTVLSQTRLPDGTKKVSAFKEIDDEQAGATTRLYADGRRVRQGREAVTRTVGDGLSFVTRHDGLRSASLPDGRLLYEDRFASMRDERGARRVTIERTRYARWWHGHPQYERRPLRRHYDVVHYRGVPLAYYRPTRFAPASYRYYDVPFALPVVLVPTWVAFASPVAHYEDPSMLLGDLQIASAFAEGHAYSTSVGASPERSPSVAALRRELTTLRQKVGAGVAEDRELADRLASLELQGASSQVQDALGRTLPVAISEELRQQMRQQVRLAVAMQRNGHPLILADVLASGYARLYVFQTAEPLDVAAASGNGRQCFLNTGDLIGFATLPADDSAFADMRVLASGAGSCSPGEVVRVRLADLQEMLNGFSERVEDNLERLASCAAAGKC